MSLSQIKTTNNQPPQQAETALFLDFLYADRSGFVELAYAPSDPKEGLKRYNWYAWPRQSSAMLDAIAQLSARYGDVYASVALYPTKDRKHAEPLPTDIVFVDDAPAPHLSPLPYSFAVQTSANSYHVYFKTSSKLDNAQRKELARRARILLAGDHSGEDAKQLVRLPASLNTKRGGRWPVRIAQQAGPIYTPVELASKLPALPVEQLGAGEQGGALALDWQAISQIDIARFLNHEGLPRRITKRGTITDNILRGVAYPYKQEYKALGYQYGPDFEQADTSQARYDVAKGFAMAKYERDLMAALLLYFCNWNVEQKGVKWLQADIERCIKLGIQSIPNYRPTPEEAKYPALDLHSIAGAKPRKPPRRKPTVVVVSSDRPQSKGRPVKLDARGYLQWCKHNIGASDHVMSSIADNAQELGVSRRTILRIERELKRAGLIARHTSKGRRASWLVLDVAKIETFLSGDKNTNLHELSTKNAVVTKIGTSVIVKPESSIKPQYRNTTPTIDTTIAENSPNVSSNVSNALSASSAASGAMGSDNGACVSIKENQQQAAAPTVEHAPQLIGPAYGLPASLPQQATEEKETTTTVGLSVGRGRTKSDQLDTLDAPTGSPAPLADQPQQAAPKTPKTPKAPKRPNLSTPQQVAIFDMLDSSTARHARCLPALPLSDRPRSTARQAASAPTDQPAPLDTLDAPTGSRPALADQPQQGATSSNVEQGMPLGFGFMAGLEQAVQSATGESSLQRFLREKKQR